MKIAMVVATTTTTAATTTTTATAAVRCWLMRQREIDILCEGGR